MSAAPSLWSALSTSSLATSLSLLTSTTPFPPSAPPAKTPTPLRPETASSPVLLLLVNPDPLRARFWYGFVLWCCLVFCDVVSWFFGVFCEGWDFAWFGGVRVGDFVCGSGELGFLLLVLCVCLCFYVVELLCVWVLGAFLWVNLKEFCGIRV